MHELSIATGIVELAEDECLKAGGKYVSMLEIEIGTLAGVVIEALRFALDEAIANTLVKNAEIVFKEKKAIAVCSNCKCRFETFSAFQECPDCSNPFSDVIEGKDLLIKKIQVQF